MGRVAVVVSSVESAEGGLTAILPTPLRARAPSFLLRRKEAAAEFGLNAFGDGAGIFVDGLVPESDDPPAEALDHRRALGVVAGSLLMAWTVDLNDQAGLRAGEVGEVAADRVLPPKLHTLDLLAAQEAPEAAFALGRFATELASSLSPGGSSHAAD
jgi:hypothetical protein